MDERLYVLAASHMQYVNFCREFNLNPYKDAHYISTHAKEKLLGLSINREGRPKNWLILLEDYYFNTAYDVSFIDFLNFFTNYGKFEPYFLSDGERYNI